MNKFKVGDKVEWKGYIGEVIEIEGILPQYPVVAYFEKHPDTLAHVASFTKIGEYISGRGIELKHVEEAKDLISESLQKENKELKDRIRQLEDRISRVRSIFNEDFHAFMEGVSNE